MSKIKIGNIKGPKGDKGETGAVGPKGEQGIQGPVGPAGGVDSVNGMTGDVTVEDTQGVNLLLDSDGKYQVDKYQVANYRLSSPLVLNQAYTFTIWGDIDEEHGFYFYIGSAAMDGTSELKQISEGIYSVTHIFTNFVSLDDDKTIARIYAKNKDQLPRDGNIKYVKIERGTVPNPVWTPAPEDIATHTDVEQAVTGENLLLNSATRRTFFPFIGAEVTVVENVAVAEWGATDACRVSGSNTTSNVAGTIRNEPVLNYAVGKNYTLSIYIKNNSSTTDITLDANSIGNIITIKPGEAKKVIFAGSASVVKNGQFVIKTATQNVPFDFTYWHPKIEEGIVANPIYTLSPTDQLFHALDPIPEAHRNNYRGRNLGESTQMSEAHKAAIQDGSFKDLFVGDYWTHEGINYRIADVDYFYNCGDTTFTKHHLVIVPDTRLSDGKMNTDNTTENGYVGSEMRQTGLEQAKEKIQAAFPDMVLTHRDYFTNKVTNGVPSGGEWTNSDIELMNEIMVYGCHVFAPANNGTNAPNKYTTGNSQLALFRLNPRMIKTRYNYWLRDVFSAAAFALVNNYGLANCVNASYSNGVRPYFCIGVAQTGDEADDDMEVVSPMQEGDYMEEGFE